MDKMDKQMTITEEDLNIIDEDLNLMEIEELNYLSDLIESLSRLSERD